MDVDLDRAYDLDLESLLASPPKPHDGWLGRVDEPGGLRLDEIVALGTRKSTSHHGRLRGGTVLDDNGVPLDENDKVAVEDVRTLDMWYAAQDGTTPCSVPAAPRVVGTTTGLSPAQSSARSSRAASAGVPSQSIRLDSEE